MALDHAALLEVLEVMKTAGVEDRVKVAAQTIYQALIDAELTAVIGADPWEQNPDRSGCGTGTGRGCCRRRPGIWSCRSRSCGRVLLPLVAGAAAGGLLGVVAVEVSAAEDSGDGGDHPDGCGQDDGEREQDGRSDGRGSTVIGGGAGRVVHHLRRRPANGGA